QCESEAGARSPEGDAVSVLELPARTRAIRAVHRLPPRKGIHQTVVAGTDEGAARQSAERSLLQLRRPDRPRQTLRVPALQRTALAHRYEEAQRNRGDRKDAVETAHPSSASARSEAGESHRHRA